MRKPPKSAFTYDATLQKYFISPSKLKSSLPSHIDKLAVGAFIFQPSSQKLLLLQRASHEKFPNIWEVCGGGVEHRDPTILHAAAREAYEETGLVVTHFLREVDVIDFRGSTGRRWRKFNFEVLVERVEEGDVMIDEDEHRDWKWVEKEDVVEGMQKTGWSENMLPEARMSILKAFDDRRNGLQTQNV